MLSSTYDWENKLILGQGAHSVAYKVKHRNRCRFSLLRIVFCNQTIQEKECPMSAILQKRTLVPQKSQTP